MLYAVSDKVTPITTIPHKDEYDRWMKGLSEAEHKAIMDKLDSMIDGNEVNTSSWMPGNKWKGTVFYPIYTACGENETDSGLFFGLLVWVAFMNRTKDDWSFGHYSVNNIPIKGLTYFKIHLEH